MYINTRITKGTVTDWGCFDEVDEYVDAMFGTCDSVTKKPIDIDDFISDLETFGDTRRKNWKLFGNNDNLELVINFENGFYVCFEPTYYIEGRY